MHLLRYCSHWVLSSFCWYFSAGKAVLGQTGLSIGACVPMRKGDENRFSQIKNEGKIVESRGQEWYSRMQVDAPDLLILFDK